MKKLIKTLLREGYTDTEKIYNKPNKVFGLDEAAFNINHLPETVGLFIGAKGIDITLYDPNTNSVFGTLEASLRSYDGYDVDGVAAEKGFGPLTYELAMMHASKKGKGLMPNRAGDVRSKAFSVWEKFYDRNDIIKTTIEPIKHNGEINPSYRIDILTGDKYIFKDYDEFKEYYNNLKNSEKKALSVFNTIYTIKPNSEYNKLIQIAKNFESNGFDTRKAILAGNKYFSANYE